MLMIEKLLELTYAQGQTIRELGMRILELEETMKAKPVKAQDLPESTLPESGGPGAGVFLYCPKCCARFSATRGDYWHIPEGAVLTCGGRTHPPWHEKVNLILAREERRIVPVDLKVSRQDSEIPCCDWHASGGEGAECRNDMLR